MNEFSFGRRKGHHLVKHREKNESGSGDKTSPDRRGVPVRSVERVGEEVHEGVPHEGAHGQGNQQRKQGFSMSPLQKGHRAHGCQTNLEENINPEPRSARVESINVLNGLTTDMTVIEEKLTSQVAMESEAS